MVRVQSENGHLKSHSIPNRAKSAFWLTGLTLVYAFPLYQWELYRSYSPDTSRSIFEIIHDAFYVETVEATKYVSSHGIDLLSVVLILLCVAATSFVLVSWANSAISKFNIKAEYWPYLGASIALKFLILFTFINGPSAFAHWPEFPGTYGLPFVLSALFAGLWAASDPRPATLLRLVVLSGLAFLALSFMAEVEAKNVWLTIRPEWHSDIQGQLSPYEINLQNAPFRFIKLILEIGFIGFFIGWIHALGAINPPTRISLSQIIGVSPHSLLFGKALTQNQIFVGAITALFLVGLVTAQNTAIFRGSIIWPTPSDCEFAPSCLVSHLLSIPRQFDTSAFAHAAMGSLSALPFIVLGSLVLYGLNRRKLNGILPVLGMGALLGYLWSFSVPEIVWTNHLSWQSLCSVIAMIIAAGSRAAAQAAPAKIRFNLTPPKSQPES